MPDDRRRYEGDHGTRLRPHRCDERREFATFSDFVYSSFSFFGPDVLTVEGFASLGSGLYVHPREWTGRVVEAVRALALSDSVHVFRGDRAFGPDEGDFVRRLWDLEATAGRYRAFIERYAPLESHGDGSPRDAFALRFGLVFEFLRITWDDPDLPIELLPDEWPGEDARQLTSCLYRRLLPGASEFANDVMESL